MSATCAADLLWAAPICCSSGSLASEPEPSGEYAWTMAPPSAASSATGCVLLPTESESWFAAGAVDDAFETMHRNCSGEKFETAMLRTRRARYSSSKARHWPPMLAHEPSLGG